MNTNDEIPCYMVFFSPCPLVIQIVLGLHTLCSTLFWSSYACLSCRVQSSVSHLHETTDGIINFYILICRFSDRRLADGRFWQ